MSFFCTGNQKPKTDFFLSFLLMSNIISMKYLVLSTQQKDYNLIK